jgi:hypothetical protein
MGWVRVSRWFWRLGFRTIETGVRVSRLESLCFALLRLRGDWAVVQVEVRRRFDNCASTRIRMELLFRSARNRRCDASRRKGKYEMFPRMMIVNERGVLVRFTGGSFFGCSVYLRGWMSCLYFCIGMT